MNTWDDLRDLGSKIDALSREHRAWSIVYEEVQVLVDHIYAKARIHELNARTHTLSGLPPQVR